jgi:hypothetical protein
VPNSQYQYELIDTLPINSYNFNDSNVLEDSTYTYAVLAYNQFGISDTSNTSTITTTRPIPVELISFSAVQEEGNVVLHWSTASELNNLGFEVERKSGGDFYTIGFVKGLGTTTEIQNYSFTDLHADKGINYYRLKQNDFNGKYTYSEEIEINFTGFLFFSLDQNYPNPFNPNTSILFNLASESKVSLKVFDLLGQEIKQLVNSNLTAGHHTVEFDASQFNSGIYFYRLEAIGSNGESFSAVKKMIFTK